jgi:hypothetical protein
MTPCGGVIASEAVDEDDVGLAIGVVTACDLVQSAQGSASFRKAIRFSIAGERQFYMARAARLDNSYKFDNHEAEWSARPKQVPALRLRGKGLPRRHRLCYI